MDGKGFQVWLSAARRLTRAQRREALAVRRAGAKAGIEGSSLVWTRPGAVRTRERRGGLVWRGVCGATSARTAAGPSTR